MFKTNPIISKSGVEITTAPTDPRFATTQNQANHCWTAYNEWLLCARSESEGVHASVCQTFRDNYRAVCPATWDQRWSELRQEQNFYGVTHLDEAEEAIKSLEIDIEAEESAENAQEEDDE